VSPHDVVERQAVLEVELDDLFPIQRIIRIERDGPITNILCQLPNQQDPVLIPFAFVEILHPELLLDSLENSEALLSGR
jgi:hypothetical protein